MTHLIQLLPDILANQIAAGEVVQRPASVVKELLENAVDAGSSNIKVLIKDAGKTFIQVIDNGTGMSAIDARASFKKHTTSKIRTVEDLSKIQTMGFRGEALASIAAVAQLDMETCRKQDHLGTRIAIEGAKIKTQAPIAMPPGTKVSVKNLFFNVPARRNFLKSNPVETKHIIDELQRMALARSNIAFSYYQNEQEIYQLPVAKLSHRIVHLFGETYKKQLLPCQEATDVIQIQGYIGKPEYAKKTRGEQFFFVNQRFIKSTYLHHAVKSAFTGLLPQDVFPFYVLFIDIAPHRIDVNVHPTKTEIKFEDERMVYAILAATIKQALAKHHVTPSLDFEQNTNFNPFALTTNAARKPTTPFSTTGSQQSGNSSASHYAQFKSMNQPQPYDKQAWEKLFQRLATPKTTPDETATPQIFVDNEVPPVTESSRKVQLHGRYILTQIKSGILLIEQQAAHERILYERYLHIFQKRVQRSSQQLLFPVYVTLNPADLTLMRGITEDLQCLGFVVDSFGKDSIIVTGCPVEALVQDTKQLLEGLLEQFKSNQTHAALSQQENLARSLARRTRMRSGQQLQQEEVDKLIEQLFSCTSPYHTPDGQKICLVMTLDHLNHVFQTSSTTG